MNGSGSKFTRGPGEERGQLSGAPSKSPVVGLGGGGAPPVVLRPFAPHRSGGPSTGGFLLPFLSGRGAGQEASGTEPRTLEGFRTGRASQRIVSLSGRKERLSGGRGLPWKHWIHTSPIAWDTAQSKSW
ncbi:unnamed protein product [Lota lota]